MQTEHKIVIGNSQNMSELADCSVHLVVTSPPYPMIRMWDTHFIKMEKRIGEMWRSLESGGLDEEVARIYDSMHENLAKVWRESFRVLVSGGIACINIGDATRSLNGKFRLFPNHARIIEHCERAGFTTLPYILWKKPTTKPKYKGKGAFLGSGFLPPNAYVTLDCEFILLFRKGNIRKYPSHDPCRYQSAFTKKQRDEWFSQIWTVKGERQTDNQVERRIAAFPEEIVERLVKMFSIKGETVLDPFLGSGTTTKMAMLNDRNSVGYEINTSLLPLAERKIAPYSSAETNVVIVQRSNS